MGGARRGWRGGGEAREISRDPVLARIHRCFPSHNRLKWMLDVYGSSRGERALNRMAVGMPARRGGLRARGKIGSSGWCAELFSARLGQRLAKLCSPRDFGCATTTAAPRCTTSITFFAMFFLAFEKLHGCSFLWFRFRTGRVDHRLQSSLALHRTNGSTTMRISGVFYLFYCKSLFDCSVVLVINATEVLVLAILMD